MTFFFLSVLFPKSLFCQIYNWSKAIGDVNIDISFASAIDNCGNLYTIGTFSGTVDFDNGPGVSNLTSTSQFGYDMFILKLDSLGYFTWVKRIGGGGMMSPRNLCFDSQNNIYLTGSFYEDIDFDPGPSAYTYSTMFSSDLFVLKLNSAGNFLWCKDIGTPGSSCIGNVIKVSNNTLMIGGDFCTANGGPINFASPSSYTMASGGTANPYILKLDTAGNFIWVKGFIDTQNSLSDGSIKSLEIGPSGDIYLAGFFKNSSAASYIDFDPGPGTYSLVGNSSNMDNSFLLQLNSSGQLVWAHSFPCYQQNTAYCLHLDSNGNVLISGRFQNTVDFDPGPSTATMVSAGSYDSYLCKFDANGNYIWAKTYGGLGYDACYSFQINNTGNIYATGRFDSGCDFDPSPGTTSLSCSGVGDSYVSAFDANGNFQWVKQIQSITSNAYSEANSLTLDQWNNIYVSGYFRDAIDLNTEGGQNIVTSIPNYNEDVLILKLGRCEVPLELTPSLTICTSQCATLTANGATTYTWVSGPNASQYTVCPASTTIYSVSGNISLTCIRSNSVMVTIDLCAAGLTENSEEPSVSVFPNPANSFVTLVSKNSTEYLTIKITDVNGRILVNRKVQTSDYKTNLDLDLFNGIYFVTIINSANVKQVKKLVIAK